jgi:hypothetical protein
LTSATVASFGMLMVLLIAPEMNGWPAAIMRMWPRGDEALAVAAARLAQSNTGRCSA